MVAISYLKFEIFLQLLGLDFHLGILLCKNLNLFDASFFRGEWELAKTSDDPSEIDVKLHEMPILLNHLSIVVRWRTTVT